MEGPSAFVKVPRERVAVLIGQTGNVKSTIETKLSVALQINSETGYIEIKMPPDARDPTTLFRAKEVVLAIGRGFSPEHAFRLLNEEEAVLEIIDLREIVGRSQSKIKRLKGRVIGKEGKTRRIIEELTGAIISVYGHTIAIIGSFDQTYVAKEAVRMLIRGSLHRTVYRFLQKKRSELKKKEMELWEKPDRE